MTDLSPVQESFYFTGVLDYGARINAHAIVLSGTSELIHRLHAQFGGHVEWRGAGVRLVVRAAGTQRKLLEWWLPRTQYRRAEIEAALDSLGAA